MADVPLSIAPDEEGELKPTPDPVDVDPGDTLVVTPPEDGCAICVDPKINGVDTFNFNSVLRISIPDEGRGEAYDYTFCIALYDNTCKPKDKKRDGGHTIHVSSGI